jgi:hypothetical protein
MKQYSCSLGNVPEKQHLQMGNETILLQLRQMDQRTPGMSAALNCTLQACGEVCAQNPTQLQSCFCGHLNLAPEVWGPQSVHRLHHLQGTDVTLEVMSSAVT